MVREKRTKQVHIKMEPNEHDNFKKFVREQGHTITSFIRLAINNELERIETYNKEKNQTWDLE